MVAHVLLPLGKRVRLRFFAGLAGSRRCHYPGNNTSFLAVTRPVDQFADNIHTMAIDKLSGGTYTATEVSTCVSHYRACT